MFETLSNGFRNTINKIRFNDDEKALDKALDELKADGTYDKLIQKWFGNVKGFDAKGAGER